MTVELDLSRYDIYLGGGQLDKILDTTGIIYSQYGNNPVTDKLEIPFTWSSGSSDIRTYNFKNWLDKTTYTGAKYTTSFNSTCAVSASYRVTELRMQIIPPVNFRVTYVSISCNGYGTDIYRGYAEIKTDQGNVTLNRESSSSPYDLSATFTGAKINELNLIAKHANEGNYDGSYSHYCRLNEIRGYFIKPWEEQPILQFTQQSNWQDYVDIKLGGNEATSYQIDKFTTAWNNGIKDITNGTDGIYTGNVGYDQSLVVTFKDRYKFNNIRVTYYSTDNVQMYVEYSVQGYLNDVLVDKKFDRTDMDSDSTTVTNYCSEFDYIKSITINLDSGKIPNYGYFYAMLTALKLT